MAAGIQTMGHNDLRDSSNVTNLIVLSAADHFTIKNIPLSSVSNIMDLLNVCRI